MSLPDALKSNDTIAIADKMPYGYQTYKDALAALHGYNAAQEEIRKYKQALLDIIAARPVFAYVNNTWTETENGSPPKWDKPGSPYDRGQHDCYERLKKIAAEAL